MNLAGRLNDIPGCLFSMFMNGKGHQSYRSSQIFLTENVSLIKKIQDKIFSWMHDFLKIFLP